MWLSLVLGLSVRYGSLCMQYGGAFLTWGSASLLMALGGWAHVKASNFVWAGLRRVVGWIPILLVASPLLIGQWMAEPMVWLGPRTLPAQGKVATVVLLYDELNAQSSLGLQQIMRDRGLLVHFKPVTPVHRSTTEVVPELFARIGFEDARACGLSRICAHGAALDFAQLSVQRDDVDLVGFHHPYCAMQGLRFCRRLTTNRSVWDDGRWDCALLRRTGLQARLDHASCQQISHRTWADMRDEVIKAMLDAPAVREGGVLFVHLPLPHPPARETGTLAVQYKQNLKHGEQVLGQLLDTLAANQVEARMMVFADHPFRQAMWCAREAAQFDAPCVVDPALMDDRVPLIVAGKSALPDISHVQTNAEVFDVLRSWLALGP
jgi:hypothetical protein